MARLSQSELVKIFDALKRQMTPFEKGTVKARINIEGRYELWSEKPGLIALGKLRSEMAFAAIIIQSSYVGFYYTPIYTHLNDVKHQIGEELLKALKGKGCFHIKSHQATLMHDVSNALTIGYTTFQNNGWV